MSEAEPDYEMEVVDEVEGMEAGLSTTPKSKPGIVYLSRIPPHMSPSKLRHILSAYGSIGRVYLAQKQSPSTSSKGKSKTKAKHAAHIYEEGWVEFTSKKVAKSICGLLNGRNIGGKKSSRFHDDIWSLKYLPGFKWPMLTSQMATERAAQADKLRLQIESGKREETQYLEQVEKARVQKLAQEKKAKRKGTEEEAEEKDYPKSVAEVPSVKHKHKKSSIRVGREESDKTQVLDLL
ncbi:hypothetical protein BT69DRAFT_1275272 [Atractiella rhizophila]|nr:hypothetical protein BT69DRAFT_1275272 [Atractiella rhizophila]